MIKLPFKLNITQPKKVVRGDIYAKDIKDVQGVVIEDDDGNYTVEVFLEESDEELSLSFTPRSFELVGKTNVFTRTKDEYGRPCRVIRDKTRAKFHPGLESQYVPFAKNWIVEGDIVRDGIVRLFDFKKLIGISDYIVED